MTRPWVGRALMAVGVIHTLFGLFGFRRTFGELLAEGLWNTVNGQLKREFAFWFVLCGLVLVLLGALVHTIERTRGSLPRYLGWSLLALTIATVVVMPISGGWLLFPGAIGAVLKRSPP